MSTKHQFTNSKLNKHLKQRIPKSKPKTSNLTTSKHQELTRTEQEKGLPKQ